MNESIHRWSDADSGVREYLEQSRQRRRRFRTTALRFVVAFVLLAAVFSAGLAAVPAYQRWLPNDAPQVILPADFETHEAMLMAWPVGRPGAEERVLMEIIKNTTTVMPVVLTVPDEQVRERVASIVASEGIAADAVRFVVTKIDSLWARDFAPRIVKLASGGFLAVDAVYDTNETRLNDDFATEALAPALGIPHTYVPLAIDGGNLLSNGAGLCLTTDQTRVKNEEVFLVSGAEVTSRIQQFYGAEEVVYLEPLVGEPTGHADMFATFVAPDVVVVGQYDPSFDPINAKILDRNAERLSEVRTRCGPLQVHRIPMPNRVNGKFLTYTNVIFANGLLLIPQFADHDPEGRAVAMRVYQRLLPAWRIVPIESSALMERNGSLHCATLNLYRTSPPQKSANRRDT